jgi:type II secretory pathway predicted ATPase ExeA
MDRGESVTYLRHHLALAGRIDPLIADDACARLHKASGGLPRALNNAAIAALIAAATAGKALDDDWRLLCQEAKAGCSGSDRSTRVSSASRRL